MQEADELRLRLIFVRKRRDQIPVSTTSIHVSDLGVFGKGIVPPGRIDLDKYTNSNLFPYKPLWHQLQALRPFCTCRRSLAVFLKTTSVCLLLFFEE